MINYRNLLKRGQTENKGKPRTDENRPQDDVDKTDSKSTLDLRGKKPKGDQTEKIQLAL